MYQYRRRRRTSGFLTRVVVSGAQREGREGEAEAAAAAAGETYVKIGRSPQLQLLVVARRDLLLAVSGHILHHTSTIYYYYSHTHTHTRALYLLLLRSTHQPPHDCTPIQSCKGPFLKWFTSASSQSRRTFPHHTLYLAAWRRRRRRRWRRVIKETTFEADIWPHVLLHHFFHESTPAWQQ